MAEFIKTTEVETTKIEQLAAEWGSFMLNSLEPNTHIIAKIVGDVNITKKNEDTEDEKVFYNIPIEYHGTKEDKLNPPVELSVTVSKGSAEKLIENNPEFIGHFAYFKKGLFNGKVFHSVNPFKNKEYNPFDNDKGVKFVRDGETEETKQERNVSKWIVTGNNILDAMQEAYSGKEIGEKELNIFIGKLLMMEEKVGLEPYIKLFNDRFGTDI